MNKKETYNGWSNYATWRINLEIVDGIYWSDKDTTFEDIASLTLYLKDTVETCVIGDGPDSTNLVVDYAKAFIDEVNYFEIAQKVAEDHPSLITGKDTQDGEELTKE